MKYFLRRYFIIFLSFFILQTAKAGDNILNLYTWSGVIPDSIVQQFQQETGIKVNFSTYDSNEVLYTKLKASKTAEYDVIEPSSYYIERMRKQDMLEKLNKGKLSHFSNLNPAFLDQAYDPGTQYSLPFIWGATGIFVNKNHYPPTSIKKWGDLWDKKYADSLMLLDDSREVFSIALLVLGYSANDSDPQHIKEAYLKLKSLSPNIKIYNVSPISIMIDEDASLGSAWNGDVFKAKQENPAIEFIYPQDGFVIWVDNFAIVKNAPHKENAYKFLNFMLRADIAKAIMLYNNFPTPNLAAQKLLPKDIQESPIIYPSNKILKRGEFQKDISNEALDLYEKYWELLKLGR